MDSDDEMSDESDEYASVNLSDDEGMNPTQKQQVLAVAQQKIAEAGSEEEEENEEEHEDDDHGVSTSNFNKTSGSLSAKKKGEHTEEPRLDISLEDRILRTRDRYLVNPAKHPGYQIDDVRKTVVQKTMILSQMLKKKLANYVRQTVITFITVLVYHRDFAAKLKRERIFKATDFGWQLGMKFDLVGAERALEELNIPSTPAVDPFDPKLQAKI